tara:strand:+ start:357 stop:1499 length:1143 start_codon:yes stop_codon:yes gene_type:complete
MKRLYFDISATTPIDLEVSELMNQIQNNIYGNPSSIHREGQAAKTVIEKSRRQISSALNCNPEEIIFTSSGSESNNMVLKGCLIKGDHFITSSYEHPAILKILPSLEEIGVQISIVKPDKNGIIKAQSIKNEIRSNTKLISIMWVNNELGTINNINEIGQLSLDNNIKFHTDGVQALGKIPINLEKTKINFISMSAHKLYGPKGVGALYVKKGESLKPLIHGGSQESNLRASTENISGIGGFGLATEKAINNMHINCNKILTLEKYFIESLNKKHLDYKINGINRVPGVFNITFNNFDGQSLVLQLDIAGIGISFGAACSSGTTKTSSMLTDIGLTENEALSSVRISIGKIHNKNDIDTLVEKISNNILNLNNKATENER